MKHSLFLFLLLPCFCFAQITIWLSNPSFEDTPAHGRLPAGWKDCGDILESAPDIQPGFWGVTKNPRDGASYLGMVVREQATYEAIGQKLPIPMTSGTIYAFSMHLAKSPLLLSPVRSAPMDSVSFDTPVVLRVYAGMSACDRLQLLAETAPIDHSGWKEYLVLLTPQADYTHISFVAYFAAPYLEFYNGHLLADHFSDLVPVNLSEVSDEDLAQFLANIPRTLFDMTAGCEHPAPAVIQSVLHLESKLEDMDIASLLHVAQEAEIQKYAANLKTVGADAHAALLLELWPNLQKQAKYKSQKTIATTRWAALEAAGPFSAIRTQYAIRHRDAILQCIRQFSGN